jgi:hypothetical protein
MKTRFGRKTALPALMLLSLSAVSTDAGAMLHKAYSPRCRMTVSDLLLEGKPATYDGLSSLDGVFVASTGTISTPPVTLPNGRKAALFVEPNGCVRINQQRDFLR